MIALLQGGVSQAKDYVNDWSHVYAFENEWKILQNYTYWKFLIWFCFCLSYMVDFQNKMD